MTTETLQVGQPRGLWVLFATEMWERFSYYGMRALLVLYLISASDDPQNPGFGWMEGDAYRLYGLYTCGRLSDADLRRHACRPIPGHASVHAARWRHHRHRPLPARAHGTLRHHPRRARRLQTGPGAVGCFMLGLFFVIVGTGFFKPCVAVMAGQLYGPDDPRREGGFTVFYMGINVGAMLAPLVAGTLGETVGWHWGFGAAGVGMIAGLITYQFLRPRYLADVGLAPERSAVASQRPALPLDRTEWQRVGVILLLALFGNVAFWAGFEQVRLLNCPAQSTDEPSGASWTIPSPTWYQSVNPASVILFRAVRCAVACPRQARHRALHP